MAQHEDLFLGGQPPIKQTNQRKEGKNVKKLLTALLAAMIILSLSACVAGIDPEHGESKSTISSEISSEPDEQEKAPLDIVSDFKNLQKEDVFPYGEKINLSWYYGYYSGYFTGDFVKLEDHPFMKRREEDTNIHITYQVPTATTLEGGRAKIETMLASGTLTDLVTQTYFGLALEGPTLDSVIDEEIYLNLTELSEQNMPNFNRMRERFPLIDKIIETPRDNIVYIPMLSGLEKDVDHPKQTGGLVIRKDFLDECQLDVPETVDDRNNVLTKFKQMGVETPLALGSMKYSPSMGYDMFITAYGLSGI